MKEEIINEYSLEVISSGTEGDCVRVKKITMIVG